jgi:hypothetical protein
MRLAICFAFILISTTNAQAAFFTAGHLLETCQSYTEGGDYNNADERLCNAYIMGVHDTAKSYESLYAGAPLYCEPPRVNSDQMVLAVKRYLLANPEFAHSPAAPKVVDAFTAAFPCN